MLPVTCVSVAPRLEKEADVTLTFPGAEIVELTRDGRLVLRVDPTRFDLKAGQEYSLAEVQAAPAAEPEKPGKGDKPAKPQKPAAE